MTIVFVHGNPETSVVWDLLAAQLAEAGYDDQVRLSPPGFGSPIPNGFGGTVVDYRDWLIGEHNRFDEPVDLVGHDWGGGHTVNVAMTRPDLLRSWCSDMVGLFDPEYVWHELAQRWQTPGDGEAWLARALAQSPEERATRFTSKGMDPSIAARLAADFDGRMSDAILPLYRSARQPVMAKLGAHLEAAAARPGLAILATEDPTGGMDEQRRRSAARAGAHVETLDGFSHWWMTEDDGRRGAAALITFWSSLPPAIRPAQHRVGSNP